MNIYKAHNKKTLDTGLGLKNFVLFTSLIVS